MTALIDFNSSLPINADWLTASRGLDLLLILRAGRLPTLHARLSTDGRTGVEPPFDQILVIIPLLHRDKLFLLAVSLGVRYWRPELIWGKGDYWKSRLVAVPFVPLLLWAKRQLKWTVGPSRYVFVELGLLQRRAASERPSAILDHLALLL